MRDEFTQSVKEQLAKRVGFRCSNPDCRRETVGPQTKDTGVASIGEASHITAASSGGARYDASLTPDERKSAANGIWLCKACARLIDVDETGHSEALLREWKELATAFAALELRGYRAVPDQTAMLKVLESEMPKLFAEMREDLSESPIVREFIIMGENQSYNLGTDENIFVYYFEEHEYLRQMVRVLENKGFISDITFTNVDRFVLSEDLADFLKSSA